MTEQAQKSNKVAGKRLLVVANRLPVNLSISDNGDINLKLAAGGLVSGLQALSKTMKFCWFGWPGAYVHKNDRQLKTELASQFNAVPVFLNDRDVEGHYNGFSSRFFISKTA